MKTFLRRVFPSFWIVFAIKFALYVPFMEFSFTLFSWIQVFAFALVWAFFHRAFKRKHDKVTLSIALMGGIVGILSLLSAPLDFVSIWDKLWACLFGLYLILTSIEPLRELKLMESDRNRTDSFSIFNVPEVRRISRFYGAIIKIINDGAQIRGEKKKAIVATDSFYLDNFLQELFNTGCYLLPYGEKRYIIQGTRGAVVLRFLICPGDYEYKDGKWYFDGKPNVSVSGELDNILKRISKAEGNKRGIIVKAFEGGSVKGQGCGYYIMDVTRGNEKLIDEIRKTIGTTALEKTVKRRSNHIYKQLYI